MVCSLLVFSVLCNYCCSWSTGDGSTQQPPICSTRSDHCSATWCGCYNLLPTSYFQLVSTILDALIWTVDCNSHPSAERSPSIALVLEQPGCCIQLLPVIMVCSLLVFSLLCKYCRSWSTGDGSPQQPGCTNASNSRDNRRRTDIRRPRMRMANKGSIAWRRLRNTVTHQIMC